MRKDSTSGEKLTLQRTRLHTLPLVKRCEICGGVGDQEFIVTCSACRITREHVYCMWKVRFKIPDVWICDECTSNNNISLLEHGGKEGLKNSYNVFENNMDKGIRKGFDDSVGNNHSRKPKTGKVKFLDIKEVMRLDSGATKRQSPLKTNSGYKHGSSNITSRYPHPKPKARIVPAHLTKPASGAKQLTSVTTPLAPQMIKVRSSPITPAEEHRSKKQQRTDSIMAKGVKIYELNIPSKKVSCNADAKKATRKHRHIPKKTVGLASTGNSRIKKLNITVSAKEGETAHTCIDMEMEKELVISTPNFSSASNSSTIADTKHLDVNQVDLLSILPKLHVYRPWFPARHATWKGGFKFYRGGQFYCGFNAHPSSRVHRKAYNFSLKMPEVLQVQLVPQQPVLTHLFHCDYPELHDIALYFSSSSIERSEETLFELMKMKNSAMISCIDDVELLIFTSNQLHFNSQTIMASSSMKHFLWGVFRHAKGHQLLCKMLEDQSSIISSVRYKESEGANTDCREYEDMKLDVEDRKPIGTVDVAVPKHHEGKSGELEKVPVRKLETLHSIASNALREMGSELQKLQQVSYNTDKRISYTPPEVVRRINPTLPSADRLQNSLGRLSEAWEKADMPPGFEDKPRATFRH
ncbi:hypothetical protein K2173_007063 [Erythroxylum novogranatense]|uniref:AIPP2-like SPOC-like domain-containing protein n=1 Tax=Erythroxylum novogranatense TaxID=1862640 RepID=A0AAV8SL16_9ROSI|nr:hypothetical protein K2173_007063 [Erythroxylum novogranatense]